MKVKVDKTQFKQLSKLDDLEEQVRVCKSNAHICQIGMKTKSSSDNLLSLEDLCADKKAIKFEISPVKKMEWYNLKPEQKNLL